MVTHIVIFTWIAGVTTEQVTAFADELTRLASDLREVATMQHGPDLAFRDGNGDYALVSSFADQAAWAAYQAHPRHKAFLSDFVHPLQASRLAIQF